MFDWAGDIIQSIDDFFAALEGLSKQQRDVIGIAVLIVGALFVFLGFRFFKYLLGLAGFLGGAVVGLTVFYYIPVVNTTGQIGQLAVGAVLGAMGAVLFYFIFYYFGVFVFGSVAAMWLGMVFLPRFPEIGEYRLLIVLALGFGGGLLALLMRRVIVIITTSAIGAVLVAFGIGHFFNWPVSATNLSVSSFVSGAIVETVVGHDDAVIIAAVVILTFLAGVAIQWRTSNGRREEPRD